MTWVLFWRPFTISEKATVYLDFDGVIADSALECINTAITALAELAEASGIQEIYSQQLSQTKSLAIANRHLVMPPENFYCLIKAAQACAVQSEKSPTEIEARFRAEVADTDKKKLDRFKSLFFTIRNRVALEGSDESWHAQNPATPFIQELTNIVNNRDVRLVIVSRKDEASLRRWIAGGPFSFDCVYGNHALELENSEKFALISKLQNERHNRAAVFVDDAIGELAGFDWASIGVTPLEAGWGYNGLENNYLEITDYIEGWLDDLSN